MATILVADDDAMVVSMLLDYLDQEGYAVLVARDGAEALAVSRRELPDLVLSDIKMPLMDGIELLRALRDGLPTRAVAVILMSATDPPDLSDVGAAFIAKPFRLDTLSRLIADQLAT